MGGTTPNYALRFPYIDETITDASTKNLADDVAAVLTNTLDVDRAKSLGRASGSWFRSGNQSVSANTETAIAGTSETFDTDGAIDIAGQPTRFTVPAGMGGIYLAMVAITTPAASGWSSVQVALAKNGTDFVRRKYWTASGQEATRQLLTGQISLAAADFITTTVLFQGTPNPSNVSSVRLSVQRLTT